MKGSSRGPYKPHLDVATSFFFFGGGGGWPADYVKRYAMPDALESNTHQSEEEAELSPLEDFSEDETTGMEL